MRLLICTQAVDLDDPVLGFFHRWVAELAKRSETVHVICLKEGRHDLPKNVFIHSLGKESGPSRMKYVSRFYRYVREFRGEYDAVFVHMNSEYAVLGGPMWRLWGKRIVLWRNHKMPGFTTRLGVLFSTVVCYTSPSAFVAKYKKAVQMPVGIDTEFFSPGSEPKPRSILFLGRLDPVKRVDVFIKALEQLHEQGVEFTADIIGDPTEPTSKYAHDIRNMAATLCLDGVLTMKPAVTNDQARDLYRSHSIYCNLTPSGSFDKTILEAMACGEIVVVANAALKDAVPRELCVEGGMQDDIAVALRNALQHPLPELRSSLRLYVIREHSLTLLSGRLIQLLIG